MTPHHGEIWLVDMGMAAKTRPTVVLIADNLDAARVQISTAKGAKSVLHHLAQSQDQRKTASALEPCAQLEFQSTAFIRSASSSRPRSMVDLAARRPHKAVRQIRPQISYSWRVQVVVNIEKVCRSVGSWNFDYVSGVGGQKIAICIDIYTDI